MMLVVLQQVFQGMLGMVMYTVSLIPVVTWLSSPWEKFFVTEKNLRAELEDLEAAAMPSVDASSPDLEVTDMNDNKLTIKIKSKTSQESVESYCESSEDIEVIHQHNHPKLQGILKQRSRTQSESSDEVFSYSRENSVSCAGSESPISESEEGWDVESGRRVRQKSVSFSEHLDKTTYKESQPTTSLRSTLKNKRKKHRKAERKYQEKVERRRQRGSDSISEMSSDGENCSTRDELCNNNDDTEETAAVTDNNPSIQSSSDDNTRSSSEDTNGNIETNNDTVIIPSPDVMGSNQKGTKNKRRNRKNNRQSVEGDEIATAAHEPLETSKSNKSSESENGDMVGSSEEAPNCCDNKDVMPNKKLVEVVADDGHDSDDNVDAGPPIEDGERTFENEALLSWQGRQGGEAAEVSSCPLSLSNSIMYDLD